MQPKHPPPQGDVAFGAFQRGYYLEAFREASRRASEQGDPVAMTLLGELYANGYGVAKDEKKALAWFSLAADRGDRQAIFALAMFRFAGRGGPQDQAEAAALLDKAAKLGHVAAAYNLALLYLEGQQVRQDIARAAELLRGAADAGSPEAQYALATLYKEGNGVPKDPVAAAKLLGAAARSGNEAAQVEYAIALFNGTGIAKDESGAAAMFRKAAQGATRWRRTGSRAFWRPAAACPPIRSRPPNGTPSRRLPAPPTCGWKISCAASGMPSAPPARTPRGSGSRMRSRVPDLSSSPFLPHSALIRDSARRVRRPFSSGIRVPAQSALLNVMNAAARKAGRSLKRDFGEVANLQVSLKGPANFVSAADHRAEEILRTELLKARPGYGFLGEEGGIHEGTDKTHPGSSTRSTAPPTSCTAFRISASRSRWCAKARRSRV